MSLPLPISVTLRDVFPPAIPVGLVSVPTSGVASKTGPSIDLSWQPNNEADLAGYMVYRVELGGNRGTSVRLTVVPIAAPAYRDLAISLKSRYEYCVTAIDRSGNESAPSAPGAGLGRSR